MKAEQWPMCQGEQFYFVHAAPGDQISLGLFKSIPLHSAVCLACGFVSPSVDHGRLIAIHKEARSEGMAVDEEATKREFPEV